MAVLATDRSAWLYVSDDGNSYVVSAQKALTDQGKQGGSVFTGTQKARPLGMHMRTVTVTDGHGNNRAIPVYSVGAPIATAGATINLNLNAVSTVFTSKGVIRAEHLDRRSTIGEID